MADKGRLGLLGNILATSMVAAESLMVIVERGGSIDEMRESFEKLQNADSVIAAVPSMGGRALGLETLSETELGFIREAYLHTLDSIIQEFEQQIGVSKSSSEDSSSGSLSRISRFMGFSEINKGGRGEE